MFYLLTHRIKEYIEISLKFPSSDDKNSHACLRCYESLSPFFAPLMMKLIVTCIRLGEKKSKKKDNKIMFSILDPSLHYFRHEAHEVAMNIAVS